METTLSGQICRKKKKWGKKSLVLYAAGKTRCSTCWHCNVSKVIQRLIYQRGSHTIHYGAYSICPITK